MKLKLGLILCLICSVGSIAQPQTELPASLTVEQAVELSLSRNQDVVTAVKDVDKAKATVGEARSAALPQVNFEADATHVDNYNTAYSGDTVRSEQYSAIVSFSQALSTFGRVDNALRGAKIYVQLAESKLELAKQTVTFQVTQAFYDVLLAQELITVNRQAIDIAESHLHTAQLRYEQGTGSEFEMLRAKVRVANLQPGLIAANNQLVLAKQNLNAILNIAPEQPITFIGKLSYTDYLPSSDSAWQVAQQYRPDLRILNQSKQIAEVQLKYYKAGYRPNLYLVANYTDQLVKFGPTPDDWVGSWYTGLSLQWPIFDGFRTASQIRGAKSGLAQTQAAYEKGLLFAQVDVKQTCLQIKEASTLIASALEAVKLAERSLSMAKISFENGRATTLDVSDAQLALTTAQTNFAQAEHDYQVAIAKLKLAIGTTALP
ncbi:MAG: TolC family protein [bacterium]